MITIRVNTLFVLSKQLAQDEQERPSRLLTQLIVIFWKSIEFDQRQLDASVFKLKT